MTTAQVPPAHRIVVGVDGSACSIAALDWAVHQAALTGATVEALTTWEWPNTFGVALVVQHADRIGERTLRQQRPLSGLGRSPELAPFGG